MFGQCYNVNDFLKTEAALRLVVEMTLRSLTETSIKFSDRGSAKFSERQRYSQC